MYNIGIGIWGSGGGGNVIHGIGGGNVCNCGRPNGCRPPMSMKGKWAKIKIVINNILKKKIIWKIVYTKSLLYLHVKNGPNNGPLNSMSAGKVLPLYVVDSGKSINIKKLNKRRILIKKEKREKVLTDLPLQGPSLVPSQ